MTICIRHGWYQNDGTVPADCPSCMLEMRPFEEYICPSCAAKDLEIARLSAIVERAGDVEGIAEVLLKMQEKFSFPSAALKAVAMQDARAVSAWIMGREV